MGSSFFKGCSNVSIHGGQFTNIGGDAVINNNYSQHGREMSFMRSRTGMLNESRAENTFNLLPGYREENYAGHPPPHRPPFGPPQDSSTVLQTASHQQMVGGGPHGSYMLANGANIPRPPFGPPQNPSTGPFQAPSPQHHMRWNSEQWLQHTTPQTQTGNSGGNYPQNAYSSSSRNAEGNDPINTGMANLSVDDSRPRVPTQISPANSFSSDPHTGLNQMGFNPSTSSLSPHWHNNAAQQGSHPNPSPASHANEQDMVGSLSPPTRNPPSEMNPSRPPPPASTSPFNFPPSSSSARGKRSGILRSIICPS